MKKKLYIWVGLFVLTSFAISKVVIHDSTKEIKSNSCSIHQIKMNKTYVKTTFGFVCKNGNLEEFSNAKTNYCLGCVEPLWPMKRVSKIYHCKSCDVLKSNHKASFQAKN